MMSAGLIKNGNRSNFLLLGVGIFFLTFSPPPTSQNGLLCASFSMLTAYPHLSD